MKIESAGICRANQKIYEKLIINDVAPGLTIAPHMSQEGDISPLPCKLYHLQGNEYVSVYPDLAIGTARYAIGAFDAEGKRIDSATHAIDFNKAKWKSRKNYRLKPELCKEIRLYDETHDETFTWGDIKLKQAFGRPNCVQYRTIINLLGTSSDTLQVTVLDGSLGQITNTFTFVGEKPQYLAGSLPSTETSVSATLDIPWDAKDTFVIAQNKNNPDVFAQLFISACQKENNVKEMDDALCNSVITASNYDKWFRGHRLTPYEASKQKRCTFGTMPLFSIIVPLYKTPIDLFDEMLDSLLAQTYQNWECILVNSTPEDKKLTARVDAAVKNDGRVRVVTLKENLGISLNTNAGIAIAKGDFICFFDHDDTTEPDLLFEYVKELNSYPDTDILYCDEDKLSADGAYCTPNYKIDFSLDLLRNNNYICHMLCIRKSLLAQLKPNTKDLDGAQDHSLTLQAIEKCRRVGHAARILYHWRKAAGSTAASADAKPYAVAAGILGIQKHLERVGLNGEVASDNGQTIYKVKYDVPKTNPLVSIVVFDASNAAQLKRCIDSIISKSTYTNFEIIIPCRKNLLTEIQKEEQPPCVKAFQLNSETPSHAEAINLSAKQAAGEYLLLFSSSNEVVTPNWVERMLGNCARPEVGAVGVKLCYPDEIIWEAGIALDDHPWHVFQGMPKEHWVPYYAKLQRNVSAVSAACCMVNTELFHSMKGFDAAFAQAFGDVDFCLKLQDKNKLIVYLPDVEIHHYESIEPELRSSHDRAQRSRELNQLRSKWPKAFACKDPYYCKGMSKAASGATL